MIVLNEKTSSIDEKRKYDRSGGDSHFPDGGLAAWLTAFGVFLIQVGGPGFSSTFGVFEDFYTQHYLTDYTPSTISWIGSTCTFLILSGGLLFGRLYDKGYFYWLVISGCTLQSFCLFMLSLTQRNQYYQVFLSQGLGFGLAASMSYVPSLSVLSHHFGKRRAIVMSISAAGSSIGAIGYTLLLSRLLDGNLGFANSIRILAAANAVVLFIGCALMRTSSRPNARTRYSQVLRSFSADYPFVLGCIGMFVYSTGAFFPLVYLRLDSNKHGLGNEFSFYTMVILNGGNIIGHVAAGFIAKCCGISNTIAASTLFSGIVIFAMTALSTRVGAANIGFFFGCFLGVYVALSAPIVPYLTHDLSEIGARMGIAHFMAGLGGLIGPPVGGALLGFHYRWWRPAVFCGCLSIASTALFLIMELGFQRRRRAVSAPL